VNKSLLVTGSRGFLGTYLVAEGKARGYQLVEDEGLWFPSAEARAFVAERRPRFVLHAAGQASVAQSLEDPAVDFDSSVVGTHCLLDALRTTKQKARVVFLSSAAVYGEPATLPIRESHAARPISPYGFHKLCAETVLREHAALHGVEAASLRIFSAYGPGLPRQVVYDMIRRIRPGEPLRLDGTGAESRDFVHAADVARAAFDVLERAPAAGEIYNVASGTETTLRTLAEHLRRLCGEGPIEFSGKRRPGDPANWRADIEALRALGFSPAVALEDGLRQVREWVASRESRE
jgi:UDP-glucose 4-epimerase